MISLLKKIRSEKNYKISKVDQKISRNFKILLKFSNDKQLNFDGFIVLFCTCALAKANVAPK